MWTPLHYHYTIIWMYADRSAIGRYMLHTLDHCGLVNALLRPGGFARYGYLLNEKVTLQNKYITKFV